MARSVKGTFETFIAKERQRLASARDSALDRRKAIDTELASIARELEALEAYQAVKEGRGPATQRRRGGRRGEKRQMVLDLIKSAPGGLSRGELIEKLKATEKSAQQSISNVLAALFKQKTLRKNGRKYLAS